MRMRLKSFIIIMLSVITAVASLIILHRKKANRVVPIVLAVLLSVSIISSSFNVSAQTYPAKLIDVPNLGLTVMSSPADVETAINAWSLNEANKATYKSNSGSERGIVIFDGDYSTDFTAQFKTKIVDYGLGNISVNIRGRAFRIKSNGINAFYDEINVLKFINENGVGSISDICWAASSSATFKFEVVGNLVKAYKDGILLDFGTSDKSIEIEPVSDNIEFSIDASLTDGTEAEFSELTITIGSKTLTPLVPKVASSATTATAATATAANATANTTPTTNITATDKKTATTQPILTPISTVATSVEKSNGWFVPIAIISTVLLVGVAITFVLLKKKK